MKKFVAVMDKVNKCLEYILVGLLMLLTISVAAQIMSRLLRFSMSWIEELIRYSLIWMAILGSALAVYRFSLINVDIILRIAPKKVVSVLIEISSLLSMFFTIMVVYSSFAYIKVGVGQISPALRIDMSYIYLVIPIGFTIMFFNILANSFKRWNTHNE